MSLSAWSKGACWCGVPTRLKHGDNFFPAVRNLCEQIFRKVARFTDHPSIDDTLVATPG
jgi:hypothetical protein